MPTIISRRIVTLALLLSLFATAGCQTWTAASPRSLGPTPAEASPRVRVTPTSGPRFVLSEAWVEGDSTVVGAADGAGQFRLPVSEVGSLEVRATSWSRTGLLLATPLALLGALFVLVVTDGPCLSC